MAEIRPQALSRGATEDIKVPGSTFVAIIKSGAGAPAGFKTYLNLIRDGSLHIPRLL